MGNRKFIPFQTILAALCLAFLGQISFTAQTYCLTYLHRTKGQDRSFTLHGVHMHTDGNFLKKILLALAPFSLIYNT